MEKKQKNKKTSLETVEEIINIPPSKNDPQGMYTGKPVNQSELPVQDNDDI